VVDAVCDALLDVWLLLVDDVQPAIDNEATITSIMIANNFFIIYLDKKRRRDTISVIVGCATSEETTP
jgi:1,4-dihydroxy-2-naphthoate octaprenyltransferase